MHQRKCLYLKGTDFSGSDLRAAIFSRAVMPGVNLEGSDMQNVFMDYVVLRVRGVNSFF